MTRDEQAVLTLLQTLLHGWAPGPKPAATGAQPGEGGSLTSTQCPSCRGTGNARLRGIRRLCQRCNGTGDVVVDAYTRRELPDPDPDLPISEEIRRHFTAINADTTSRAARRLHERDLGWEVLERLDRQLAEPDTEAAADPFTRAVDRRDRLYRHGDYLPLERALTRLRWSFPRHHHLVWHSVVCAEERLLSAADEEEIGTAVAILAGWMRMWLGRPVRVPVWLDERPPRQPGKGRGTDGRALARRDAQIRARFDSGDATRGELMREYRLSRSQFYEVLYGGPAASAAGTAA